jgi:anionic cell wall polymer biosynthesis LytR-Cps2A-Psr (LCP) family protein
MNLGKIKSQTAQKPTRKRSDETNAKKVLYSIDIAEPLNRRKIKSKNNVSDIDRAEKAFLSKLRSMMRWSTAHKILSVLIVVLILSGTFYYIKLSELRRTGLKIGLFDPFKYGISAVTKPNEKAIGKLDKTNNRTNTLILGVDTREKGGTLNTDSILLLSYNHENNEVAQISFPRDLEARYVVNNINRSGKINGIFPETYATTKSYDKAFENLGKGIEEITGLPLHYGVMINFQGFQKIVDSLGGVTIKVDNSFTDYTFPCMNGDGFKCVTPKTPDSAGGVPCAPNNRDHCVRTITFNAGEEEMKGTRALEYSRSRHSLDNGEGSDYARARRQNKVLNAVKEKMISTNLFKKADFANDLIGILGDNIKFYNLEGDDIKSVIESRELITELTNYSMVIDPTFGNSPSPLLEPGNRNDGAGFLVMPVGGNYKKVQALIGQYLENPYLLSENAKVAVLRTNAKRTKSEDYFKIKNLVWEKRLGFSINGGDGVINVTQPGVPTKVESTAFATIYTLNDKAPKTLEFYKSILSGEGKEVVVKQSAELPKELERFRAENNFLVVVE